MGADVGISTLCRSGDHELLTLHLWFLSSKAKKVQAELKPLGLKGLIAFVGHTSSGRGDCSMCFPQKGRVVGGVGRVGGGVTVPIIILAQK